MEWVDIQFSIDLVEAALRHLRFLEDISAIEELLQGPVLEHGLRRYEQLWLPLAMENRHLDIVPPLDVGWLWYIHMLSPLAYKRDCRKLVGGTLDHSFKDADDVISCANRAVEVWYEKYPKSGYSIIRNGEYVERKQHYITKEVSKLSVSLTGNANSHLQFCYQVALPHFRDRKYLDGALKRYKQFLCLKKLAPEEFLTPCVDIILMWYTHMCHPVAYAKDLTAICGQILDNNVKVKYALIDQNYITARDKTSELWTKVSTDEFVQPGTKLRSSENKKEIFPVTLDDLKSCCVIEYDLYLTDVDLIGNTEKHKFELKVYLVDSKNLCEELFSLTGNKRYWPISSKFHFNTDRHRNLKILLLSHSRLWCFKGYTSYADGNFNLRNRLQNMGTMVRAIDARVTMESVVTDTLRVDLNGSVHNATPILCRLQLVVAAYEKQLTKAAFLRRTWGHYKMPDSISKSEYECFMAVHTFQNQEGVDTFRCRLIHIPDLLRSGVEIFFRNKLVATSYVIGSSHLPTSQQVQWSDLSVSLDPELGERAMLLRNYKGDWAICIGRWVQEPEGSYLDIRLKKLGLRTSLQRVEIRTVDIQFQSFNANLHTGSIQINPSNNTVAENLAVMWSICILYVLCSPRDISRPIKIKESVGFDENAEQSSVVSVRTVPEADCKFLVAAGLLTEVPSNEEILREYGSLKHDILMDAQDVIIAEQKLDRRLLRKESKIRTGDHDGSPKKIKKRKSSSSLKYNTSSVDISEPEPEHINDTPGSDKPMIEAQKQKNKTNKKEHVGKKRKKFRKKKSSGLDDMLSVSDDSFTKEDIEALDKILVTNEKGRKVVKKKDSNVFDDVKLLKRDSFDLAAKDDEEYYEEIEQKKLQVIEEQFDNVESGNDKELALEIKEQTAIIKDVAERKRDLVSRHGDRLANAVVGEEITAPSI